MAQLKAELKTVEQDLRQERHAIEKEEEQLKNLEEGSDEYNELEELTQKRKVEFNLDTKREKAKFLELEATIYRSAQKALSETVAKYAKRNGIRLVLQVPSEPSEDGTRETLLKKINHRVVFQDRIDITDAILKLLNEREEVARRSDIEKTASDSAAQ